MVPEEPPIGIPPAEVEISTELVVALVEAQHPDLADLEIRLHGSGWDNTTFRLGSDLAVRLPRRLMGAELILKEQLWLPELARRLPISISAPVRVGTPAFGYPWAWSIVPWIEGVDAVVEPLRVDQAPAIARLLGALHQPAPVDAPRNEFRGVPLVRRCHSMESRLARIGRGSLAIGLDRVAAGWAETKTVPIDTDEVWIHGDIHARNVIGMSGKLRAVVDWGDLCVGDPATDLAAAWILFPAAGHAAFRAAYGPISDDTRQRARGWAIHLGVVLVDAGDADDPAWAEIGRRVLERAC